MPFVLTPFKRELAFVFDARTSRGAMKTHQAHYLKLHHTHTPEVESWGECSPLPGLSLDDTDDFYSVLQTLCGEYNALRLEKHDEPLGWDFWQKIKRWPSIAFAWETAWVDYLRGAKQQLYPSPFSQGKAGIRINGLIWMGDPTFMREQIKNKMDQGFSCLKLKIGGLDFEQELTILKEIRKVASPEHLELRLDANGAFKVEEAQEKLQRLSEFNIHSIEQPIKAGQLQAMATVCKRSPIPIALDEELISITEKEMKWQVLKEIQPACIILKPTLVGGFSSCREWIQAAKSLGIDWWLTSALESNIGLNAIAQFSTEFDNPLPQGLGTGQLYHNNLNSPLEIKGEELWYNPNLSWQSPDNR